MRSRFLPLFLLLSIGLSAQITISEISYNPPESNTDSLEYIELYNTSANSVDLSGWSFSDGITLDSLTFSLPAGGYGVVAVNANAMKNVFGIDVLMQWTSGGLSNGGEVITLVDAQGLEIVSVDYGDRDTWPSEADGTDSGGASIELCDVLSDPTLGENWRVATTDVGVMIDGKSVLGTPQAANTAICEIIPDAEIIGSGINWSPADVTINVGQTVRWTNGGGFHNVNGTTDSYPDNPEGFGNGNASSDLWIYDFTFTIPGVYDFHCDPHLTVGMSGTVTVVDPNADVANIIISEIMYNDPGADDELEFIELYNNSDDAVNLEGYSFSSGITHTFSAVEIEPRGFVLLCKDSIAFERTYGFSAIEWETGGLSNGGELLTLINTNGGIIDEVMYEDDGDWSQEADGGGSSLNLCNIEGDNNMGSNWTFTDMEPLFTDGTITVFASPGMLSLCKLTIEEVTQNTELGVNTYLGSTVEISGVVYSPNFRSSGVEFALIDDAGDGISVYSTQDLGYSVNMGDILTVVGEIQQFSGLARIVPTSINIDGNMNILSSATDVNALNEETESQYIKLSNVSIVDPTEWSNSGSGFNVQVTNGTDNFTLRIDADVPMYSMGYPQGTFSVEGIGGQFDGVEPFDDGYQLLPRFVSDIDPYDEFIVEYTKVEIDDVNDVDVNTGVSISLTQKIEVSGTVYGTNLLPSGQQFTLIDDSNNGIGIYNDNVNIDYTVVEGDIVTIRGSIEQFRGLTQIAPDEIIFESSGNSLVNPRDVTILNEDSESSLVRLKNVTYVDDTQWRGDGTGFSVDVTDGTNTFALRIDNDSPLSTMNAPDFERMDITGIGGQFDTSDPLLGGYQILPRYLNDFVVSGTSTNEVELNASIYPNPVGNELQIDFDGEINEIEIFSSNGKLIGKHYGNQSSIPLLDIKTGLYYIKIINKQGSKTLKFIKL